MYKFYIYNYIVFSASLEDTDIFNLSERITNGDELMKLGVKVLGLPKCKIKSALCDHSDSINSAAYEVLSKWRVQHENPYEAYSTLMSSLEQHNMMHFVGANQEPLEETRANLSTSAESKTPDQISKI